MLSKYYEDIARWSFPFQMQVLLSHIKNYNEARDARADVLFVERSPLAAQLVFGKVLLDDGDISDVEAELFDEYVNEVAWKPDAVIYLRCPSTTCHARILQRLREGEEGIPLDYLDKVGQAYEDLIRDTAGKGEWSRDAWAWRYLSAPRQRQNPRRIPSPAAPRHARATDPPASCSHPALRLRLRLRRPFALLLLAPGGMPVIELDTSPAVEEVFQKAVQEIDSLNFIRPHGNASDVRS